jgi:hypothetical protein
MAQLTPSWLRSSARIPLICLILVAALAGAARVAPATPTTPHFVIAAEDAGTAGSGPVTFRPPPGASPEEVAQVEAYCAACNQALDDGAFSDWSGFHLGPASAHDPDEPPFWWTT